jgi:hypothetical protein
MDNMIAHRHPFFPASQSCNHEGDLPWDQRLV